MPMNMHELGNSEAFFELLRAGLWEKVNESWLIAAGMDWIKAFDVAEDQGVTGLIAAGMERMDLDVPLEVKLQFVGSALQTEQRNKAMNVFIADIVEEMSAEGVFTLLVKGQGIAQCYEKPLWRPSGNVDFLLSEENYRKAKNFLLPLASDNKGEERYSRHLGMNIGDWYVEIHGSLRTGLSARVDKAVDEVLRKIFYEGNVRSWQNGKTQISLPAPTEDVFLVFTHFIKHFYKEGMSLRQVCDWCRLLWTYRDSLNYGLLESWVEKSGLMKEWRAFGSLAVDYLGMSVETMPFCDVRSKKDEVRGGKLMEFCFDGYSGNKYKETFLIAKIFPWKAFRYSPSIFLNMNWLKIKERLLK